MLLSSPVEISFFLRGDSFSEIQQSNSVSEIDAAGLAAKAAHARLAGGGGHAGGSRLSGREHNAMILNSQ